MGKQNIGRLGQADALPKEGRFKARANAVKRLQLDKAVEEVKRQVAEEKLNLLQLQTEVNAIVIKRFGSHAAYIGAIALVVIGALVGVV